MIKSAFFGSNSKCVNKTKLSSKTLDAVKEAKAFFFDQLGSSELMELAVQKVGELLDGHFSCYQVIDGAGQIGGFVCYPAASEDQVKLLPVINDRLLVDHPLIESMLDPDATLDALTITDFVSQEAFEETPLYKKAYSHLGFRYQLSVALMDDSAHSHVLSVNRRDSDFSGEDRVVLETLFPAFLKALKCNHLINERLNQLNSTVVLTGRENEVLLWIAEGKTNAEIAMILGISPRTVAKHVENLFVKLGFENRASAIRYVLGIKRLTFNGRDLAI